MSERSFTEAKFDTSTKLVEAPKLQSPFEHVLACLDHTAGAMIILERACEIALAAGAKLTAMRVIPPPHQEQPVDPVDWQLSSRDETERVKRMGEQTGAPEDMDVKVVSGHASHNICKFSHDAGVDLIVLGARDFGDPHGWGLGGTARHVAENFDGSVLIIPPGTEQTRSGPRSERRIAFLLDGSPQADSVLPIAAAIARSRAAELLLMHALPEIDIFSDGPPEPGDETLREELKQRAERTAKTRMGRIKALLATGDIKSRVRLLSGDEPRRALARALCADEAELVVLSARGHGNDPDLRIGSTGDYLLTHAATPMLLVRNADRATHRNAERAPPRRTTVRGIK
ncbi:universal stress protein [Aliiruegeria lutimaris]|uniref:Nucleotide-binding universal stress protein, UspA family n=1 Tax=Aliiruegeria lutimaris TaxID=571298 RepID=A0A1G8QS94_9RHOB|nr:universal stress protein [Aliiruegeria lutimaris]SDJ07576.1 Nucleotide-binding universal stress protein, UspA family [Aliiruegeria lutimaris]